MNKRIQEMYLDFLNNYLTVEKFSEHNMISLELATLIIKEGRIQHELKTNSYDLSKLDTSKQNYFNSKMSY